MALSEWDRYHIHDILDGAGTWFEAKLLRFLHDASASADSTSRAKLQATFPEEWAALVWWWNHRADDAPFTYTPEAERDS